MERDTDWRSELKAQGRTLRWLADQTGRRPRTVYAYSQGKLTPPDSWVEAALSAMGKGVSDASVR